MVSRIDTYTKMQPFVDGDMIHITDVSTIITDLDREIATTYHFSQESDRCLIRSQKPRNYFHRSAV
jgi:hypothetical protein